MTEPDERQANPFNNLKWPSGAPATVTAARLGRGPRRAGELELPSQWQSKAEPSPSPATLALATVTVAVTRTLTHGARTGTQ